MDAGNNSFSQKQSISIWLNPKAYGLIGFALVVCPSLLFFFAGRPYYVIPAYEINSLETPYAAKVVWDGAFQPFFLYFVIGAAVAAWGCYRNIQLAWLGSIFVFILSLILLVSGGILVLPGAILLLAGAVLKTLNRDTQM